MTRIAIAATLGCILASPAEADLLWDNNIMWNRQRAVATSPPVFRNQRVVDDFIVRDARGWVITGLRFHILEDNDWNHGGVSEIFFHKGRRPGNEVFNTILPHVRTPSGESGFGRLGYYYLVQGFSLQLESGEYWVGVRQPNATGGASSYWFSSSGDPDGPGQSAWILFPEGWGPWTDTTAFEIHGHVVPEPATGVLAAGVIVAAALRKRHVGRKEQEN